MQIILVEEEFYVDYCFSDQLDQQNGGKKENIFSLDISALPNGSFILCSFYFISTCYHVFFARMKRKNYISLYKDISKK
jgi:hypothetical protein